MESLPKNYFMMTENQIDFSPDSPVREKILKNFRNLDGNLLENGSLKILIKKNK